MNCIRLTPILLYAIAGAAIFFAWENTAVAATFVTQIQASYDSTKCFDIFMGSLQPNYGVDIFACRASDPHETFVFRQLTDGNYTIIPQNGGNLCLDSNGIAISNTTQIVQNSCSQSPSQQWNIHKNTDGTFSILTRDEKYGLRIEGNHSTTNRTRVLVSPLTSDAEERFYLPGFINEERPPEPEATDGNRTIGPFYTSDISLLPRPEVPKGKVIEFTMDSAGSAYFPGKSQVTGPFTRHVWVYVPAQYVKGEKAPFMVSQDAGYRAQLVPLLDNAIYDKKLPVMVIIFAGNGGGGHGVGIANDQGTERNLEYDTLSDRYGKWVQEELLPRVVSETRSQLPNQAVTFTSDPEGRGTIGCSSGAVAAFTMAWFMPDSFRRVISYSGSYTNLQYPTDPNYPHGAWSYHEGLIANSAKKPIRIWLEAGTQDMDWSKWGNFLDWQTANRQMAAALASKGYHYHFDLAQDAHHCDGRVANQTLAEAMQWLWKDYKIEH